MTTIAEARSKMKEVKAPELFQFTKVNQTLEGVLVSIEPVVVKGKEAIEYLFDNGEGARMSCLGTANLNKKLQPAHIGHWVKIRYERDDASFQKAGQNAMKVFHVSTSEEKVVAA
jgi:hypothetical protein